MGHRTTSRRVAALRQAREAKAARDAERLRREQLIEQALTDFYEATATAGQIRQDARRRADKILDEAETKAAQAEAKVSRAVRALRGLGQTNADIAELCGITVGAVRALANESHDTGAVGEQGEYFAVNIRDQPGEDAGPVDREYNGDAAADGDDQGAMTYAEGTWQPPVAVDGEVVGDGVGRNNAASYSAG